MITEKDLQEAIAECKGVKNPSANTCIKLAAYLIIKEHLFGNEPEERYSFKGRTIDYESDTQFGKLIHGKAEEDVLPVVDEAIEALQVLNPRMYGSIIDKVGG